ncbi:PAS domain S-box protein [Mucilaginibacter pallidiroseus]|uniref:histidine kinase n=1 Tax=Mucilaginibacter pallidiroseus TaxID=2599295 RepID=A0A563UCF8_9SPHI|nr:PAS domain S-box protein [Mucilaginibacter pallidiroseus]TWR29061.1 PAS domain S-box protein [Mucilaginibacter pallidiroseus]
MSFKDRALLLLDNDNTIYRLLLTGLLVAAPSLHYLCFDNSYDPWWLRSIQAFCCAISLALSFSNRKTLYKAATYVTIVVYIDINNCLLLGVNGFKHVYLFSAITIFIALTLFCKKGWEFVTITAVNTASVFTACLIAPRLFISTPALVILFIVFTLIAYVSFMVTRSYQLQFKKAINKVLYLNESFRESQQRMHALISSANDTILEFDEKHICINVWLAPQTPEYLKAEIFLNKTLLEAIGPERSKPLLEAYNYVLDHKQTHSVEFESKYGQPGWYVAKASPIIDVNGTYSNRIAISVADITAQKKQQQALTQSESLLQQAQAIAKTGNWWYNSETGENYWSDNLYKTLEIDSISAGLKKFEYYTSLVHPDDKDRVVAWFADINADTKTSIDHKLVTPKGNVKYIRILRGDIFKNADGSLKHVVGIIQDITETKLSEKAVKLSQKELMEAQAIAKIGNWKWDTKAMVLSWSDEINSIFEIKTQPLPSSLLGRVLLKYVHPDDKYIVSYMFSSPDNDGISYEFRIITPKGNLKYISVIAGKLMYREDGSLRKVIGTLQDITQRKQAEIDYRRTENKYRLVLETIKLAAVSLDAKGNIIFCNKYLANLLGYTPTELLGMNWMNNFVPKDLSEVINGWFKNNIIKAHYVNPVICKNGEERIISWQNTVSFDEYGNVKETTSIGEDITLEQKARQELISAKEQAERSSHFKSEFLSIMSHEIRTPMNAVIGTTNLLLSENPKPEQLEYLNTLKFSGENLLNIINDILDYNKMEAGKLQLSHAPFNLHQLAQNIKQSFYAKAVEKNLELELIGDDAMPDMLMGDSLRLGQILINLVNNAIKFTEAGKVTIAMKCKQLNSEEVQIAFKVADTGIGISAESLEIIFDPFIQEDQVINHNYGGTGLGLAITKRLVELYHSTIDVTSELGKGTEFTFAIVFKVAASATPINNTIVADILPPNLSGMNILVVDDNKMNLMIASKFLRKWDAQVDEAINGQIAVDMALANNYDMIIMDLQMPVMDGFEATTIIKQRYPALPIIAFTADAMPETHAKAYEAGMCDYLTKPFVPDTLFGKISKHRLNTEAPTAQ